MDQDNKLTFGRGQRGQCPGFLNCAALIPIGYSKQEMHECLRAIATWGQGPGKEPASMLSSIESFLLSMMVIFSVPYFIWRFSRCDTFAPLAIVQILAGIALGPGLMGSVLPDLHALLFSRDTLNLLNGIASWGVMLLVMLAGLELDLHAAWADRRQSLTAAALAMVFPMAMGAVAAMLLLLQPGWRGEGAERWQFVLGIGMSCAVTALPILILLLEKLDLLRLPLGQRILRYASLDDIVVWAVLALIILDWERFERQLVFMLGLALAIMPIRSLFARLPPDDRWYCLLIWLTVCAFAADWCGLHYIVGAFLSGAVLDGRWFDQKFQDFTRQTVLVVLMPVFFLNTGLKTNWSLGGISVLGVASLLLFASVTGKLMGVSLAGRLLGWSRRDTAIVGWMLQTKALIMIIFTNVLLERSLISSAMFTALLLMAVASTMMTMPMVRRQMIRDA